MKLSYVYIVTNKPGGVLYTGVTSHLMQRIYQHRTNMIEGFTRKYSCKTLVYYEVFDDIEAAIMREKKIKKMLRYTKINLIEKNNPQWEDLYETLLQYGERA